MVLQRLQERVWQKAQPHYQYIDELGAKMSPVYGAVIALKRNFGGDGGSIYYIMWEMNR